METMIRFKETPEGESTALLGATKGQGAAPNSLLLGGGMGAPAVPGCLGTYLGMYHGTFDKLGLGT